METNVYAPPAAVVMDAPKSAAPEFYVVSKTKFFVLFFVTLGAYQLYWFYMHWARYRRYHKAQLWPVARAIFSIFFTHSLGEEIAQRLERGGVRHRWSPGALAAGYVLFQIIATICDRLSANNIGSPTTDVIGLMALIPISCCLWGIQNAANIACDEPHGESNRTFTWANWLWIVLGMLLWGLVLIGLAMVFGFFPE
jgi:hypothetical protein